MAKRQNTEDRGWLLYFIIAIITAIYLLFNNIFNFSTIYNFNLSQYASNIVNMHQDVYVKSKSNLKVYKSIAKINTLKTNKDYILIPKGANFTFKGYIDKKYVTWIAVNFFLGKDKIYGYVLTNDVKMLSWIDQISGENTNNNYFYELSSKEQTSFKNKQFKKYTKHVMGKYDISVASTSKDKQNLEENEEFELLFSNKTISYYFNIKDKSAVNNLYEMYCGDNYETILLNADKKYSPSKDSEFSENVLGGLIESRLFNIFLIIAFILAVIYFLGNSNSEKCSKCGSKDIDTGDTVVIAENYEYENKDGTPDKRRMENKVIQTIEIYESCNNCKEEWYYETTRDKA